MNDYRYRFNRAIDRGVEYFARNPTHIHRVGQVGAKIIHASINKAGRDFAHYGRKLYNHASNKLNSFSKMKRKAPPSPPKTPKKKAKFDSGQFKRQMAAKKGKVVKVVKKTVVPKHTKGVDKMNSLHKIKKKDLFNKGSTNVYLDRETSATATGTTSVWMTFAANINDWKVCMFNSMIRDIFSKIDINFVSYSDVIGIQYFGDGSVSQTIRLEFTYWTVIAAVPVTNTAVTFVTGTTTYSQLALSLINEINTAMISNSDGIQFECVRIAWNAGGVRFPTREFNIAHMTYTGQQKLRGKIQNATLATNVTNPTDVDNIDDNPLEIVRYSGKGTGAKTQISRRNGFVGYMTSLFTGFGSYSPVTSTDMGQAPLSPDAFVNCTKKGTDIIAPGEIKTVEETYVVKSMNFWKLYNILAARQSATFEFVDFGKYHLMYFDKLVNKGGTTSNVTLKWDLNHITTGYCKNTYKSKINPVVVHN